MKHTKWAYIGKTSFGGSMNVGTHFVTTKEGIWYLFHRIYDTIPKPT